MSDATDRTQTLTFPAAPRRAGFIRRVAALILREMSSTFGRSPGGFLWTVAEPVIGILLMTYLFSLALRSPPIGSSFALFYASGVLPFTMFFDLAGKVAQSIKFSRQLLTYPVMSYLDALTARLMLNLLVQLLVASIILTGVIAWTGSRAPVDFTQIALAVAMLAVLAFGLGTMNCFLFSMFPLWERVWAIVMRPMFLISGIFFLFDDVPEPYQSVLWFNPLTHIIGTLRHALYSFYDVAFVSPLYVFGLGMGLTVIGLILLNRYTLDFNN